MARVLVVSYFDYANLASDLEDDVAIAINILGTHI